MRSICNIYGCYGPVDTDLFDVHASYEYWIFDLYVCLIAEYYNGIFVLLCFYFQG